MSELKDLTVKHTVIYLHHIPKMLNPDMPFKNSGTILDNTDVAYFLQTDKKARLFKLTRFKDRVPVKENIEFIFNEDGTIEEALPEWIREAIRFVRAIFEEVEKGNDKKKALAKAVAKKTNTGVNRIETLIEQYAQYGYWEIVQGEHNAKIIRPLKTLEEIEEILKSKAFNKPVENQELHSCMDNNIYKSCNYTPESDTLKSEKESIKEVIKKLLDEGVEIDLGIMKIERVPSDQILNELAENPALKAMILLHYIDYEKDVEDWKYLIEEVEEGKKTFKQALEEFEGIKDIDF